MTKIKLAGPKKIILFRHGHAQSLSQAGVTYDSQRPLCEQGAREVKISAEKLAKLNIRFDIILTSPYERAQNTAKILFEILKVPMLTDEMLSCSQLENVIWQFMTDKLHQYDNIIVVGHQPYISTIAGRMLLGAGMPVPTAGFVALEFENYLPLEMQQGFAKEIKIK
jgi:phosphohistidine phosphatase